jgi:PKD repeat protein
MRRVALLIFACMLLVPGVLGIEYNYEFEHSCDTLTGITTTTGSLTSDGSSITAGSYSTIPYSNVKGAIGHIALPYSFSEYELAYNIYYDRAIDEETGKISCAAYDTVLDNYLNYYEIKSFVATTPAKEYCYKYPTTQYYESSSSLDHFSGSITLKKSGSTISVFRDGSLIASTTSDRSTDSILLDLRYEGDDNVAPATMGYSNIYFQGYSSDILSADFSATPTSGPDPLTVQFNDTSTGTPTSWLWDFGDGYTSTAQNPAHIYLYPGQYSVALTVADGIGSDQIAKPYYITVTPSQVPPTADFSATPTSGTAPLTVQFTDASTNAPTAWSWNFGDGRTSIAQSPSHTYSTAGTYTVALTVTNAGGSDTETKNGYITVSAAPPTAPTEAAGSPAFPYSQQRKETLSFLLMCWGALAFVGVFCVVIFLLMNGAQRGSGGI